MIKKENMDKPLLFLVLALIGVGVFLYLKKQDREATEE